MTGLILLLGLGVIFLLLIVFLAVATYPAPAKNDLADHTVQRIVRLRGLSFEGAEALLDDGDYRYLKSVPELRPVASLLLKERRAIALSWLRLLQGDVRTLVRFRRFLARAGAPVSLTEEARISAAALFAHCLLYSTRFLVFLMGPFAFRTFLWKVQEAAAAPSRWCAEAVGRIPDPELALLERNWAKHAAG